MTSINMKQTVAGALPEGLERVTAAIQKEGFGVLTRIDLHQKFREKLGKEVAPVVILGACNPALAYDAYTRNSDVTALLPCNVVLRQLDDARISVEVARPSTLMTYLGDAELTAAAQDADARLARALDALA